MSDDIFDCIGNAETNNEYISAQSFEEMLHQDVTGGYKPSEINRILEFISNQHGHWLAQGHFLQLQILILGRNLNQKTGTYFGKRFQILSKKFHRS